jgi:DNA-binding CsgD family transcriptional regulator
MVMGTERETSTTGWAALFWTAFTRSRNAMVLLDGQRRQVDANGAYLQLLARARHELIGRHAYEFLAGGPLVSNREWRAVLRQKQFAGVAELVRGDGRRVRVEFAGHPELVTGRHLILFVVLRTARGVRRLHDGSEESTPKVRLTRREVEVIELIALGLSGTEIAQELQLTHNTVRTHTRNAMNKLAARSRAQLVARSLGDGVVWGAARG